MPPISVHDIGRRGRRWIAGAALAAAAGLGCESGDQNAAQTPATAPAANDAAPSASGEISMVRITAAEARKHGLPGASITLEPGATGLSAATFPEDGMYLRMSGPPGGPLGLIVAHATQAAGDEAALKALAEKRFAGRSPAVGTFDRVELSGAVRHVLTCTTDSSAARAHHLLVHFARPDATDGILLDFWMPAGTSPAPAPQAMLEHPRYAALLKSVSVRFE